MSESDPDTGAKKQQSEWLIAIKEELEKARVDNESLSLKKVCIYRVPRYLREADKKAYTPSMVSIGPYHHGKPNLRHMDRHKWRAFSQTINRYNHGFDLYLLSIKEHEAAARACYEEPINLHSNDFVKMMVLDGCFILELFRGIEVGFEGLGYAKGDPVFSVGGSLDVIRRDMILLENQIPLFILDHLLALHNNQLPKAGSVAKLAIRFLAPLIPTDTPLEEETLQDQNLYENFRQQPLHCLQLFRESLVSKGKTTPENPKKLWKKRSRATHNVVGKPTTQVTYCVSQLLDSGLSFRKRDTINFWDIRYNKSVLEIPRILIHDGTRSVFRNLIAFEECHPESSNEITAYLVFMNNLIDTAEDVQHLNYKGIIEHWLGTDGDVADLFNGLCQEVVADLQNSYLSGLTDKINKYHDNPWSTWQADLKHKYFSNPWASISLIAGAVLLVVTVIQSFYQVYSYYKPI